MIKIYHLIVDGVIMYDGLLKEIFLPRSYIIMWSGDILPAITKIMCLTGHNSYVGCRFSYLRSIYCLNCKHVYYPCDSFNLNKHTENSFEQDILLVESKPQLTTQKEN